MCKEEIIPSRVKFFARALNIRAPNLDVIGAPLREELEFDGGNANDILFTAIVNDLHNSETSRLTQQDIRDLQEFDLLPATFIGDDREQREVEFQVAEWAAAVGSDRGEEEGEDLEDEENERSEGEQAAAAEEHSETTSPRITPPETARITQTRVPEVRVQLPPVLLTTLDFPTAAREVLDAQTRAESSTTNILPNEFAQQLPASIYDPTTLPTEIEQYRAELSAIIAREFEGVGEEVGRARRQRLRGDGHRGVPQPEMGERYSYEVPDALYRHWPPISPAAVHEQDSGAEMNDTAGLPRVPEEEDEEVVSEDGSGSRSDNEDEQFPQGDDSEETVSIADAVTISIAMAIAITVAVTIAVTTITTVSLLLFHRRWRRRR